LHLALQGLVDSGKIKALPMISPIAAISCGMVEGKALLDLDYEEDFAAGVDANFVMTGGGNLVEIQATAEEHSFSPDEMTQMMGLAAKGIKELSELQAKAIAG
jgi:ribonuclease PH